MNTDNNGGYGYGFCKTCGSSLGINYGPNAGPICINGCPQNIIVEEMKTKKYTFSQKYISLKDLINAYKSGELDYHNNKIMIDNDCIVVYKDVDGEDDTECVFNVSLEDMLIQCLDQIELPWEYM